MKATVASLKSVDDEVRMSIRGKMSGRVAFFGALVLLMQCGRDPLARLHAQRRVIEARLTRFDYAALHVNRSGERKTPSEAFPILEELQKQLDRQRTPENLHRLALAELAVGHADQAHPLLEEAARLQPKDAAILSDLAAAEMALGQVADGAEHSALALERNPKEVSAAFNWALALERLSNRPAAIDAWQKLLELEPKQHALTPPTRERCAIA